MVDEAIRCRQLRPIVMRRTSETGTFLVPRMRTPRDRIPILWSLHRTVSTSDVPTVTRRHTRVDNPNVARRAHQRSLCPCGPKPRDVDLRVKGLLLRPAGES
jgi:hypothetical protein